ncbi:hypothetical protein K1719_039885 [Acacia pycnantha]|nr:hypothetical protein K1719_039885 [Acacia pycnantha]
MATSQVLRSEDDLFCSFLDPPKGDSAESERMSIEKKIDFLESLIGKEMKWNQMLLRKMPELQMEAFHQLNANLLWPGAFAFAEWLVQDKWCIEGRRIIELGSLMGSILVMVGLYILLWCKSMETQNQNQVSD